MNKQLLSPNAQAFEKLLEGSGDNHAKQRIRELANQNLEAQMFPAAQYDLLLIRRHPSAGNEIFSQRTVPLGKYSEYDLYGEQGSPQIAFKGALNGLLAHAKRIIELVGTPLEFAHQVALFWADVGRLNAFLGVNQVITELVAEARTARFQFRGKDTPVEMIQALADGFKSIIESPRWDTTTVDRFVEILERAGFDSLIIDAYRKENGDSVP